ncbi:F0F1 ATP synthase subunit delta [Pseudomaricurvus sp. HS19]|uniref:F0F1 ATP synthase subunit delta n=1 Tax=Pseudomaricurvus sp. HS19 TaxID=2692626 RepID=UPI0013719511
MELNWSTFVLEIINFLVLIWILKHFLYRPVLAIIARRQESVAQQQQQAEALRTEATAMQEEYQQRLSQWQQEQQQARNELQQSLAAERQQQRDRLQQELDVMRHGAEVAEQRQRQDRLRQQEQVAMQQGAQFAAQLLRLGAGPETEKRLTELLIHQLLELDPEQRSRLQRHNGERSNAATIASAWSLGDDQRERLGAALQQCLPEITEWDWQRDPELLAGVRITVGAWELGFNLADELSGFAELGEHG